MLVRGNLSNTFYHRYDLSNPVFHSNQNGEFVGKRQNVGGMKYGTLGSNESGSPFFTGSSMPMWTCPVRKLQVRARTNCMPSTMVW